MGMSLHVEIRCAEPWSDELLDQLENWAERASAKLSASAEDIQFTLDESDLSVRATFKPGPSDLARGGPWRDLDRVVSQLPALLGLHEGLWARLTDDHGQVLFEEGPPVPAAERVTIVRQVRFVDEGVALVVDAGTPQAHGARVLLLFEDDDEVVLVEGEHDVVFDGPTAELVVPLPEDAACGEALVRWMPSPGRVARSRDELRFEVGPPGTPPRVQRHGDPPPPPKPATERPVQQSTELLLGAYALTVPPMWSTRRDDQYDIQARPVLRGPEGPVWFDVGLASFDGRGLPVSGTIRKNAVVLGPDGIVLKMGVGKPKHLSGETYRVWARMWRATQAHELGPFPMPAAKTLEGASGEQGAIRSVGLRRTEFRSQRTLRVVVEVSGPGAGSMGVSVSLDSGDGHRATQLRWLDHVGPQGHTESFTLALPPELEAAQVMVRAFELCPGIQVDAQLDTTGGVQSNRR